MTAPLLYRFCMLRSKCSSRNSAFHLVPQREEKKANVVLKQHFVKREAAMQIVAWKHSVMGYKWAVTEQGSLCSRPTSVFCYCSPKGLAMSNLPECPPTVSTFSGKALTFSLQVLLCSPLMASFDLTWTLYRFLKHPLKCRQLSYCC